MRACVAPVADFCILQGHDLASSGASLVTGRVAVPESLGTAGLLAWGLFSGLGKDLERQPWQLTNTVFLEVVQTWLGGFRWPFSARSALRDTT